MATATTLSKVAITGTGMYVPQRVVTNKDLEQMMDTSDEWIQQRTGIVERRWVSENETPSDIAIHATNQALQMANLKPDQLDLVIAATLTPEHFFPGTSAFIQAKLGLGTKPSLDVRCQCSGFVYALNVGQLFVATGQYDRVLVVGVEVHSRGLDLTTRGRDVSVLFGDGAGAVILERATQPEHGIMSVHLHSEGRHADKLWVEYPSMAHQPYIDASVIEKGGIYPQMDGRFVFKHAVSRLPEVVAEALTYNHLKPQDVDHYLFHQANLRINENVAGQLGVELSRVHNNIQKYGNCSAASVPILLDECVRAGKITKGQLVCLATFGSGFTWGSALVRWGR